MARVGVVLALILGVLLVIALRSIVLPIKAILLVALSLAASVGGLLLLTGSTIGSHLIGAGGPEALHPIVPVTVLAIIVALSVVGLIMYWGAVALKSRVIHWKT